MTPAPQGATRRQRLYWFFAQVLSLWAAYFSNKVGLVWRSGDGQVQFIKDMGEGHLLNSFRMMRRKGAKLGGDSSQDTLYRALHEEGLRRAEARLVEQDALEEAEGRE